MTRTARGLVLEREGVGVYLCVTRCVRGAFLCGVDPATGKSYERRGKAILERMEVLAGAFGVDALAFAVMSQQLYVVLRKRPDVVGSWTDEELVRRWWRLFPGRRSLDGSPVEMGPGDRSALVARKDVLRERLGDVSWWMRCLSEGIARSANREDGCTGRFWESRFKCLPLLDEPAIAAGMAYVDLTPIREGLAKTPATSRNTSLSERLKDERGTADGKARPAGTRAGWLAPIALDTAPSRPAKPTRKQVHPRRASDLGCLPLTPTEYFALLDWTSRQMGKDKPGQAVPRVQSILGRLQTRPEQWLLMVEHFRTLFRTAAGRPESLSEEAHRRSRRWLHGSRTSREIFD